MAIYMTTSQSEKWANLWIFRGIRENGGGKIRLSCTEIAATIPLALGEGSHLLVQAHGHGHDRYKPLLHRSQKVDRL